MSTPFRLQLPHSIYRQMLTQARAELPNECCGLLAGIRSQEPGAQDPGVRVQQCYPLVNALASPTDYESEPRSMFQAVKAMRAEGSEVLAVYHSHPTTEPVPSRKDMARNYSPDVVNLIISLRDDEPVMRAWWMDEKGYREAEWELIDGA